MDKSMLEVELFNTKASELIRLFFKVKNKLVLKNTNLPNNFLTLVILNVPIFRKTKMPSARFLW